MRIPKSDPCSVGITVRGYCICPWTAYHCAICPWTAYQCAQTCCIWLRWMWETVWGGCLPQQWHDDIVLTPQVTQNPKIWAKKCGYNCLRLLAYVQKQHINVLKHIVYVWCGCEKQFELAFSLNLDVMTSCWLHKCIRTPKYKPSSVGITV